MSEIVLLDTAWVLIAAFLVMFMHVGFTMVEVGFTQAKNALNIVMKNLATIAIGPIVFFLFGFGLMFGDSAGGWIGTSGFMLENMTWEGTIPLIAFFIFQAMFAATCATIVSGAVAERFKFSAYIVTAIVLIGFVYPVVGHWVWGGGWLSELGFVDFAGSTVVHSVGAWAALMGAWLVGPRLGKYQADGKVIPILGHNIPMGAIGVFILWFGWFGFNAGSELAVDEAIASIVTTTMLSAAAGGLASMIYTRIRYGMPDASLSLNGVLAGLVSITAGTASVSPLAAIAMGAVGGIILPLAVELFDSKLQIDDPVGAISVHGICGIWGTLAVGLFAIDGGLFYGGGFGLLSIQFIGVAAVAAWTLVTSGILFFVLKKVMGIRVNETEETKGLDLEEHGTSAYQPMVAPAVKANVTRPA
ncbi:ammonium transporter [Ammoniphilus sp. CFH 90114]|uniref:ammonium transporter n=1 Tax=Ammoniphilus sp. CFH 90114 TaxID=2493665 RepID=UPI001F0B8F28|nr:ammonium transporter [Ammoniphilus sp. CFH 90114]